MSESNISTNANELSQVYNQYSQLTQLNNILKTLKLPLLDNNNDILEILFDGAALVENLKDLSKEFSNWNQHIHCFSRLAKENDTEAKINSLEKGSLLLTVTLASGTIIAIMKATDKILDTIIKFYEVKKKSVELKKLNISYIDDAINLLEKHATLNLNRESDNIVESLLIEYNWKEDDELYNETKNGTRTAIKKILKFINKGGKVDGNVKNLTVEQDKNVLKEVKSKNKVIEEMELQMKALSDAKQLLLLEEGEAED